jgi:hypothetical protein
MGIRKSLKRWAKLQRKNEVLSELLEEAKEETTTTLLAIPLPLMSKER